jgi:peptide/nickel transport system permease protein
MLYDAQQLFILRGLPWYWIPPGVAIFLTVLAVNLVGDGLRDALDPHG